MFQSLHIPLTTIYPSHTPVVASLDLTAVVYEYIKLLNTINETKGRKYVIRKCWDKLYFVTTELIYMRHRMTELNYGLRNHILMR